MVQSVPRVRTYDSLEFIPIVPCNYLHVLQCLTYFWSSRMTNFACIWPYKLSRKNSLLVPSNALKQMLKKPRLNLFEKSYAKIPLKINCTMKQRYYSTAQITFTDFHKV